MAKYSKERLQEAVLATDSVYGVIRYLGGNPGSGGTYQHVKGRLSQFNIDISHFPGLSYNKGKVSSRRKSWEELLVHNPELPTRRAASQLRRALTELGRDIRCVSCGLTNTWNGQPLQLEVDHLDSDWRNNLPENLQYLCSNCHTQKTTNSA